MNNLELSNPVAWTDADELADMDCNTYGNIFNAKYIDIHNGRWLPLYSQGYIDFLIAQLEAAQKERDELKELNCHFDLSIRKTEGVNEVLRSKLEAAERALIRPLPIGELVHRLEGQTYEKWFSESDVKDLRERAEAAEAALSAANEKPKPISFDELADRVQFVTGGIRMSFDLLNCKGHQIVPFMNFNSLSRIVEMYRTTETYHLAGFTVGGGDTATIAPAPEGVVMRPPFKKPLEHCAAARDGECSHKDCPQLRDNEPMATGRHCPIDDWDDE
ncbi:TPA: hypothetical protein ACN217_003417 [Yersinia enterocolitica]